MDNFIKGVIAVGFMLALLFVFGMLSAIPIMYMWDYVMPAVFGLPEITLWQSFWGAFMVRLIFSGTQVNVSNNG